MVAGDGEMPVVLALPLEDARAALAHRGWSCAGVTVTAAPPLRRGGSDSQVAGEAPAGEMLVVRQRPVGAAAVSLTVARHPARPNL